MLALPSGPSAPARLMAGRGPSFDGPAGQPATASVADANKLGPPAGRPATHTASSVWDASAWPSQSIDAQNVGGSSPPPPADGETPPDFMVTQCGVPSPGNSPITTQPPPDVTPSQTLPPSACFHPPSPSPTVSVDDSNVERMDRDRTIFQQETQRDLNMHHIGSRLSPPPQPPRTQCRR